MEPVQVKEALTTAIMLGEVAQSAHFVRINGIGKVHIDDGNVALMSEAGEWKRITRENIDQRMKELVNESIEERVKKGMKALVLH